MVVISGEKRLCAADSSIGNRHVLDCLKSIGEQVAEHVLPRSVSEEGFALARVACDEVVRNVFHGSGGIVKVLLHPDGTADIETSNSKGQDFLTNNCYSQAVDIPHQGTGIINGIVGIGNHIELEGDETFITKTHFDAKEILQCLEILTQNQQAAC